MSSTEKTTDNALKNFTEVFKNIFKNLSKVEKQLDGYEDWKKKHEETLKKIKK